MPLVFSIGSIVGPMIGGPLANPLNRPADDHTKGSFLWNYPFVLPNLVSAGVFLVSIAIGFVFLEETLESAKGGFIYMVGDMFKSFIRKPYAQIKARFAGEPLYSQVPNSPDFDYPMDSPMRTSDEEAIMDKEADKQEAEPTWAECFTTQTRIYLAVYTLLAMHNTAFDQIISVFMHQARQGPDIVETEFPWKFNKGFGLNSHYHSWP
jgi:hypothetical protein